MLPVCPEALSGSGIEGKAIVEFHVEPDGTVQTATVLAQTFEQLGPIAAQCVKRWKFRPALRDGIPVGIRMTVPIAFTSYSCVPVSSYDGYYDKDYLAKRYVTKARAREISSLVAGLKWGCPCHR